MTCICGHPDCAGYVAEMLRRKAARTLDVEFVWPGSDIHEDGTACSVCGDEFEPVEDDHNDGAIEVVWEPAEWLHPQAIQPAHPACAVSNGFRLRWPDDPVPTVSPAVGGDVEREAGPAPEPSPEEGETVVPSSAAVASPSSLHGGDA